MKCKTLQSKIDIIIIMRNQGKTIQHISNIVGDSPSTIRRILNKNNINTKFYFKKYSINENYFNEINCQEKAYILGLLYADGCASKTSNNIKLCLQEEDKDILEKILILIQSTKPLKLLPKKQLNWKNQYLLELTNKIIYNDLVNFGVSPNKTFYITFPNWIEKKIISHFIRGYFDGDGCLYKSKNEKIFYWSIVGATNFCQSIKNILLEQLDIISYIYNHKTSNGISYLRVRAKKDIIKLCNWLWHDSKIHLDRKYAKFNDLIKLNIDKLGKTI